MKDKYGGKIFIIKKSEREKERERGQQLLRPPPPPAPPSAGLPGRGGEEGAIKTFRW